MSAPKYDFSSIEKKWQKQWLASRTFEPDLEDSKKPFYNLMMFPYPSAEGLHVGNMYAFTGADIYGRMKRMQGYDVFEPIGLDGFGIHSENYALKIKAHPMKQAQVSETRFYEQLGAMGNGFAWEERLETYDPEYYRWTQWVFVQLWKHGLAYRKKQAVNWCPSCKTVLADEQAVTGKCERCGTRVEERELEQWFFRITRYAERLLNNLEKIDWSERVKIAQRNWIGRSEGALLQFPVVESKELIEVFTTRPDTLFGATYIVLAPEHPLVAILPIKNRAEVEKYAKEAAKKSEADRIAEGREKTGVELNGVKAVNPASKEEVPIFVADYVLATYGTGAIMAVPAHDERDWEFTQTVVAMKVRDEIGKYIKPVVEPKFYGDLIPFHHFFHPIADGEKIDVIQDEAAKNDLELLRQGKFCYPSEGILINSGEFTGHKSEDARREITEFVTGKKETRYRLRDWLISRQRYWGVPIPMIRCESCAAKGKGEQREMPGWYAVPEEELPVKLPYVEDFRPQGKGESPLASERSFYETKCPGCGGTARRETDVSDSFLDSSWYYLRYPSVREARRAWNPATIQKWFPVNLYTGGAEHSVLHLLYVRFIALVFHDLGFLHFEEPFPKFRAHGLLVSEGAKMSKSKGNVVNPDEYLVRYGADVLRMYLMFLAPFEQGGDFRDAGILGMVRFRERAWHAFRHEPVGEREPLTRLFHRTTKKVTEDIEALRYNTAISALMILINEMEASGSSEGVREGFLKLLAPFAPHLTEELWHMAGHEDSIHRTAWPSYDETLIKEDTFPLVVQVNGKHRATVAAPRGIMKEKAETFALEDAKVKNALGSGKVKNVVYVEDRLINFVME